MSASQAQVALPRSTRAERRGSRQALGLAETVLAILITACCSGGSAQVFEPSNARIVELHAANAFAAFFEAEQRPAFAEFVRQSSAASGRSDLVGTWNRVPELAAKGEDFLETRVFLKAMADGGWKEPKAPERNERAFVEGTRNAASAFSEGR